MLYRLGGSPIPASLPSLHVMTFVLLHRDNGSLFLGAVRYISWLAWAALPIAVLAEAQAALRRRPAPRLHLFGLQGAAAKLVAVASVSFTTPVGATLAAAPVVAAAVLQAHAQPAVAESAAPAVSLDAQVTLPARHEVGSQRIVVVRPGGCLWTIAEHYLRPGARYPQLARLNLGHDMGNGQVFSDPSLIMPGWRPRLPDLPDTTARAGGRRGPGSHQEPHHHGHPSGSTHFHAPHGGADAGNVSGAGRGSGAGVGAEPATSRPGARGSPAQTG